MLIDRETTLAPSGQLAAPWGPAQLGLDGLPYAVQTPAPSTNAGCGGSEAPPLSGEAANPHLGLYTRFPAPPLATSGDPPLPGQLGFALDLYDRQHTMWSLMDPRTQPTEHRRMGKCGKVRLAVADQLGIERGESGHWSPTGFVRCGTWQCPTCGPARARERAAVLSAAIAAHRRGAPGVYPDTWLLTFTLWHHAGETQREKFDRLFDAWDRFAKSKAWKRFRTRWGVRDVVRCLDETFGARGVHPHFHVLLFVDAAVYGSDREFVQTIPGLPADERNAYLADVVQAILPVWTSAVQATGVWPASESVRESFARHALDLRGGEDAHAYVVKWGLADEAVKSGAKRDSHTDLLNRACLGDRVAGEVWRAWADATRGRNFCTSTTKLERRLAITPELVAEHAAEQQRRREAEALKEGKTPREKRPPLRIAISTLDLPAVVKLGWGTVIRAAERAEDAGEDPQRAVDVLLWSTPTRLRPHDAHDSA
jgi:Replication protein